MRAQNEELRVWKEKIRKLKDIQEREENAKESQ
jgi:hypothetical protein